MDTHEPESTGKYTVKFSMLAARTGATKNVFAAINVLSVLFGWKTVESFAKWKSSGSKHVAPWSLASN
jgi:hypothetical protein